MRDTAWFTFDPEVDDVKIGQYLIMWEALKKKSNSEGLLIFIIGVKPIDLPGLLLRVILRTAAEKMKGKLVSPEVETVTEKLMFAIGKIIKKVSKTANGNLCFENPGGWRTSRIVEIQKNINERWVAEQFGIGTKEHAVVIGTTAASGDTFKLNIEDLDEEADMRGINLIAGAKRYGKSHLAKRVVTGLIDEGYPHIILDPNNEYGHLRFHINGFPNKYHSKMRVFTPGKNLFFSIQQLGLTVTEHLLDSLAQLPEPTRLMLRRIWKRIEEKPPTITGLKREVKLLEPQHSHIYRALMPRLEALEDIELINDSPEKFINLYLELLKMRQNQAGLVFEMRGKEKYIQCAIALAVIKSIEGMLDRQSLSPMAVFAEEVQQYMEPTTLLNFMTRTRHLGITGFFITVLPSIFKNQITLFDNLFLFRIEDESELRMLSNAVSIDPKLLIHICTQLPKGRCLVIGKATKGLPFIVNVEPLPVKTGGETRSFYKESKPQLPQPK